jgi:hypothetical protein
MKWLAAAALIILFFTTCEKPEGIGGTSTITGKVILKEYGNQGTVINEYGAPDYDVYIIYGDNTIYDDDVKTHFDGSFQFPYLYKGSYTLYAYTECELCIPQDQPAMVTVEITENRSHVEAPVIYVEDWPTVN